MIDSNSLERKHAVGVGEVLRQYLKESRLSVSLNTSRVFAAWDAVSAASAFTSRKYYRDGILYVTLSSSVARSRLQMQKALLVEQINAFLLSDSLFIKDDPLVGLVKELRLK